MATPKYFSAATFKFLRDLAANNDRAWFQANKDRYERDVREPALRFIEDFEAPLRKISPYFVADARKSGGSLFRIHRDTRFARDKSPYKTHTGIQFRHEEGRDAHAPCFYLHLQPGEIFVGCGMWHPDSASLAKIRKRIAEDPTAWKKSRDAAPFRRAFKLAGESLKRPPRGFDPKHPMIDDLKRKDFIGVTTLNQKAVTQPDLPKQLSALGKAAAPFQRFLCEAIEVKY